MSDESVDPALLALVRDTLGSAVPFATHAGVVVDDVGDGTAVASLATAPELLNHVATVHAGALFTVAEAASGAAMAGAIAADILSVRPVVSSATIDYARPAHAPIVAHATVDRPGAQLRRELAATDRVDFEVNVSLVDGRDREVATFRATWVVTKNPPA